MAVMLMADMSGSTKGWINQAEREALVLLSEALTDLCDRFAIYGFPGWARKRCDVFPAKCFAEQYGDTAKDRIGAIAPKAYTRMGTPIRHRTGLLGQRAACTKLLLSLCDGKPESTPFASPSMRRAPTTCRTCLVPKAMWSPRTLQGCRRGLLGPIDQSPCERSFNGLVAARGKCLGRNRCTQPRGR